MQDQAIVYNIDRPGPQLLQITASFGRVYFFIHAYFISIFFLFLLFLFPFFINHALLFPFFFAVSKQINDKERVAAALENPELRRMVDKCINVE